MLSGAKDLHQIFAEQMFLYKWRRPLWCSPKVQVVKIHTKKFNFWLDGPHLFRYPASILSINVSFVDQFCNGLKTISSPWTPHPPPFPICFTQTSLMVLLFFLKLLRFFFLKRWNLLLHCMDVINNHNNSCACTELLHLWTSKCFTDIFTKINSRLI